MENEVSKLGGSMRGISWVCLCFCLFESDFYCHISVGTEIKSWGTCKNYGLFRWGLFSGFHTEMQARVN